MKIQLTYLWIGLSTVLSLSGCDKLIEIPASKNQIESSIIFADSTLATSALLGAYFTIGASSASAHIRMKNIGLYADEYAHTSTATSLLQFYQGRLSVDNIDVSGLWGTLYSTIYQCNSLIEGIDSSPSISATAGKSLKAEAKFLRAFCNFYLVNLYDNIPLILTTNADKNAKMRQSPVQQVYEQIIKDLVEAKTDLSATYAGAGRVRANKLAASALLARAYLYMGRWGDATLEASKVINSNLYSPLPKLEEVFLANSKETILQFWVANGFITDVSQLVPASTTVLPTYSITTNLFQAFENTDGRKTEWISANTISDIAYHYPFKYKNRVANASQPEYVMALRLSEQYLIRAEALAHQNKISDAVDDLNIIRARATGIMPLASNISKQACLAAVAKERQLELFGEWGHRFLDLKRTGQLDNALKTLKASWLPSAKAFPIPINEINYNSNLIQNESY